MRAKIKNLTNNFFAKFGFLSKFSAKFLSGAKIRFVIVGGFNTILDFGLMNFFRAIFPLFFGFSGGIILILSNTFSTFIAMISSFFLNKKYTFRARGKNLKREIILFFFFTIIGIWVIQNGFIWLIQNFIPHFLPSFWFDNFAKIVASIPSLIWNFLTYKKFVFREKDSENSRENLKLPREKIILDARIINSSTGRYCLRLIQYLEKIDRAHDYIILVPKKDFNYFKPTQPNFSVKIADFPNFSLSEQTKFNKLLKNLRGDLVHFMMPQQPILYHGAHITTIHDLIPFRVWNSDKNWLIYHAKQFVGKIVVKNLWKKNEFIITPSNFTKKDYEKFANIPKNSREKIRTIYESADKSDKIYTKYDIKFKKFLLYVGQQSDYKNLINLIKAHQNLLQKFPNLGLVLAGKINKSARGAFEFARKTVAKNVVFTGFISDGARNFLYKNCAIYVFPSLAEGFGLPPLEAMMNGAPVASSNATCLPEILGDAAIFFNPQNVDEMAEKISRVLTDEKLRKNLIEAGEKRVAEFSWEKCARETLKLYEKALENSEK